MFTRDRLSKFCHRIRNSVNLFILQLLKSDCPEALTSPLLLLLLIDLVFLGAKINKEIEREREAKEESRIFIGIVSNRCGRKK